MKYIRAQSTRSADCLRDEDSIESSATQQLVATDKEIKTILAKNVILAQPANLHVIRGGGCDRHRVDIAGDVVGDLDASGGIEDSERLIEIDRRFGLDCDRLRMGTKRRDADASARDGKVREIHDLASLPCHLALLFRVAVVEEFVDVRDDVEREGMGKDRI